MYVQNDDWYDYWYLLLPQIIAVVSRSKIVSNFVERFATAKAQLPIKLCFYFHSKIAINVMIIIIITITVGGKFTTNRTW